MSEKRNNWIERRCYGSILAILFATICLSHLASSASAQELQAYSSEPAVESFAPGAEFENQGLPRIRSLGKLVSIEGKQGDRGTLRAMSRANGELEFDPGSELVFDSDSNISELKLPKLSYFAEEPYTNYRSDESSFSYMPGNGDQFGWISMESLPYIQRGYRSGFTLGMNMHLLAGPNVVPLPPRLYDFSIGYQRRGQISDFMSYDIASTLGVFSDFEDSARDGIRFPGHAVGMLHLKPEFDLVYGIDYLSRDDIKLLPVGGFSWRPRNFEPIRMDLVFPRPRIDYALDASNRVYLAGRLGGGTWDIEFPNDANDVMTYRDLQLLLGFETQDSKGHSSVWEFGYVFDRRLQFRTLATETEFDNAFVFRMVTRK